ncbi:MAG: CotS family spore coat protein [Clostridiales bacterium]|nr:CotS family spore coat protein [Clostridiales bacterium]
MENCNNDALAEYLSKKYELDIYDVVQVKNVFRVYARQGDKCLKRVKFGKEDFMFILSCMKHLMKNGFKGILPFIPTKEGKDYIKLENGYGFLTDWMQSRNCDYSNPVDLKMAAVALSKLHNASRGFIYEDCKNRYGWGKWIEKFSSRLNEMNSFKKIIGQKSEFTRFDSVYADNVDYFMEMGIKSIEHVKQSKYFDLMDKEKLNNSFCHHDYAHHNVLITPDLSVYIIDFDYCICDTRLHDLSSLIIRKMRHGNWNIEKAQYIIDSYLEEGYMADDEIPVISAFIEFPQDFWQVGLQYYVEKLKWSEDQFNKRLNNAVNDKYDKKKFIDEFKYSIKI